MRTLGIRLGALVDQVQALLGEIFDGLDGLQHRVLGDIGHARRKLTTTFREWARVTTVAIPSAAHHCLSFHLLLLLVCFLF